MVTRYLWLTRRLFVIDGKSRNITANVCGIAIQSVFSDTDHPHTDSTQVVEPEIEILWIVGWENPFKLA
jgi:hypothetical protein